MKKILLILTGGTIGSRVDKDGRISPSAEPLLLKKCGQELSSLAEFSVTEPLSVLSENMSADDRCTVINTVLDSNTDELDGIIIAHGSDTLCYTAALASMALRHINAPIVFIASDLVLSNPDSNGPDNFKSAVTLICDGSIKRGTFICYKNRFGEDSVYLGTRLCSAEPIFDSFTPFDGEAFGKTEKGKFLYNPHPKNPPLEEINRPRERVVGEKLVLSDKVLLLGSSPALDPNRLDLRGLSAVINYGYHCGTVDRNRFYPFAKRCREEGIDVWLASFKDKSAPIYESLGEILKLENVKRLYNISAESAYARLLLGYNLNSSLNFQNLFFEEI